MSYTQQYTDDMIIRQADKVIARTNGVDAGWCNAGVFKMAGKILFENKAEGLARFGV